MKLKLSDMDPSAQGSAAQASINFLNTSHQGPDFHGAALPTSNSQAVRQRFSKIDGTAKRTLQYAAEVQNLTSVSYK
jgi:hypothetical protein